MFQQSHPVCAVWVWFKYEIKLSQFIVNSSKINEIWRSSAGKSEDSDKWSDPTLVSADWQVKETRSLPLLPSMEYFQLQPAPCFPFTLDCCLSSNSNIQLFQCNNFNNKSFPDSHIDEHEQLMDLWTDKAQHVLSTIANAPLSPFRMAVGLS